jgi:GMP synthase-like glutamine amidotransferase
MNILVIQNQPLGPVGLFGEELEKLGAKLSMYMAHEQSSIPDDVLERYSSLIVLGGEMGPYDDDEYPNLLKIVELIKTFHQAEKPIFGLCLGAQLIARALGEPYKSNNGWEIGFTPLHFTDAAQQDDFLRGLEGPVRPLACHQDSFNLPPGATLLMSGEKCVNQAYRVGKCSYGVQFHPEFTREIIEGIISSIKEEGSGRVTFGEDGLAQFENMEADLNTYMGQAEEFGKKLAKQWHRLLSQYQ